MFSVKSDIFPRCILLYSSHEYRHAFVWSAINKDTSL